MPNPQLVGATALVTGASRGFGRAIASELCARGASVVGVARDSTQLDALADELGDSFTPVTGDVTRPDLARALVGELRPKMLVLNAGARPAQGRLRDQSWESFNRNWVVDTQHVFHWTTEALRLPLEPGSTVVSFSSGAALRGSPLSGGYASAKAAIRFISAYAAEDSLRCDLGIRFVALLPQLTPETGLGAGGVAAYAADEGIDVDTYARRLQPVLKPEQVARAVVDLGHPDMSGGEQPLAYLITGAGLGPIA